MLEMQIWSNKTDNIHIILMVTWKRCAHVRMWSYSPPSHCARVRVRVCVFVCVCVYVHMNTHARVTCQTCMDSTHRPVSRWTIWSHACRIYLHTHTTDSCACSLSLLHFSPAVSEEVLGLGGRAVFDVVAEMMVPEDTTSVVSAGHVQTNDTVMSYTTAKSHFQIPPGYPCNVQVRQWATVTNGRWPHLYNIHVLSKKLFIGHNLNYSMNVPHLP